MISELPGRQPLGIKLRDLVQKLLLALGGARLFLAARRTNVEDAAA